MALYQKLDFIRSTIYVESFIIVSRSAQNAQFFALCRCTNTLTNHLIYLAANFIHVMLAIRLHYLTLYLELKFLKIQNVTIMTQLTFDPVIERPMLHCPRCIIASPTSI